MQRPVEAGAGRQASNRVLPPRALPKPSGVRSAACHPCLALQMTVRDALNSGGCRSEMNWAAVGLLHAMCCPLGRPRLVLHNMQLLPLAVDS